MSRNKSMKKKYKASAISTEIKTVKIVRQGEDELLTLFHIVQEGAAKANASAYANDLTVVGSYEQFNKNKRKQLSKL